MYDKVFVRNMEHYDEFKADVLRAYELLPKSIACSLEMGRRELVIHICTLVTIWSRRLRDGLQASKLSLVRPERS